MDLQDYRNQLDQIDDQLVALFRQRMETVRQVADYKKEHNAPVLNAGRERDILYRVTGLGGEELQEYTRILYVTLLELSRDYQENRLNTGESALCREILEAEASSGQFPSRAVLARLYGSPRNFVAALAREGMRRDELEELQALLNQLNGGQSK